MIVWLLLTLSGAPAVPVDNNSSIRRGVARQGSEWYTCDRCGFPFPRARVIAVGGLIVCRGAGTTGCLDVRDQRVNEGGPRERSIAPLPSLD